MPDNLSNPFGSLIEQIGGLIQQRQSPQNAQLQFQLMEAIKKQTRDNLASDYLASADFSRNPAASLRMLGSILNDPSLIRSSLEVQMQSDAFELEKKRLADLQSAIESGDQTRIASTAGAAGQQGLAINMLEQMNREKRGLELGQAIEGGQKGEILRAAGIAGDKEILQAGAKPALMTDTQKQLEQADLDLKRSQTKENLARAKSLSETPAEKPMTALQKANFIRQTSNDISRSQPVKNYLQIRNSAAKVNSILDTVQSQLTRNIKQQVVLVTFQKVLDELSVVRESEFIRTQQLQGFVDSIKSKLVGLIKGGAVTEETIQAARDAINTIGAQSQKFANEEVQKGRDRGLGAGLTIPELDLIGRFYDYFPETAEPIPSQQQAAPSPVFQTPTGNITGQQALDYVTKQLNPNK